MSNRPPPLTWLRAFESAARHLSFTRAAEELGLTQSAISQHVRALEGDLGTPLFLRVHRALRLTEAGRLLLPEVTSGLQVLTQAVGRFQQPQDRPRLRIASSASVAQHILSPRLTDFLSAHPATVVELRTTVWPDDFIATAADVEIRFGSAQMVAQGARLLQPTQLVAVATPQVARSFAQGQRPPLIQPVGLSNDWSDLIKRAQPDIYVDTHGLAVDLACDGAGVALTHGLVAARALAAGQLVALDLPRLPAKEGYWVAVTSGPAQALAQAFADWLFSCLDPTVR